MLPESEFVRRSVSSGRPARMAVMSCWPYVFYKICALDIWRCCTSGTRSQKRN